MSASAGWEGSTSFQDGDVSRRGLCVGAILLAVVYRDFSFARQRLWPTAVTYAVPQIWKVWINHSITAWKVSPSVVWGCYARNQNWWVEVHPCSVIGQKTAGRGGHPAATSCKQTRRKQMRLEYVVHIHQETSHPRNRTSAMYLMESFSWLRKHVFDAWGLSAFD